MMDELSNEGLACTLNAPPAGARLSRRSHGGHNGCADCEKREVEVGGRRRRKRRGRRCCCSSASAEVRHSSHYITVCRLEGERRGERSVGRPLLGERSRAELHVKPATSSFFPQTVDSASALFFKRDNLESSLPPLRLLTCPALHRCLHICLCSEPAILWRAGRVEATCSFPPAEGSTDPETALRGPEGAHGKQNRHEARPVRFLKASVIHWAPACLNQHGGNGALSRRLLEADGVKRRRGFGNDRSAATTDVLALRRVYRPIRGVRVPGRTL
ncbi:hypothetical protein EYF80_013972 [Liparis tanakae]|uniref:Uncharacterized protein n=1 Tax=Liparis tanakae TaxID=230148 RepID=A0A4Z2IE62_9TELE|nr:hypothetical protein EYF80_013972 [Liparis tanakae]